MTLLQVDSTLVASTAEKARAVLHGDASALDALLSQGATLAIEAGKSILMAIVIYIVGRFIVRLINTLFERLLERRKVDASVQSFLKSFVNIVLTVLLLISVVSALGVNTTSFAALLASMGLAFGMALSGNLQNLAGGLMVLLLKPFRVGDFIEAQGTSGTVKEIQIFHTIITSTDNKRVYLPNGALSSGNIINYSNALRRVDINVGVEYNTDAELVKRTLLELVAQDEKIIKDSKTHAPFVALSALADSSVNFTLRVWVKGVDYWDVYFRLNETIYTEFNRRGIAFPFPQLVVHQAGK